MDRRVSNGCRCRKILTNKLFRSCSLTLAIAGLFFLIAETVLFSKLKLTMDSTNTNVSILNNVTNRIYDEMLSLSRDFKQGGDELPLSIIIVSSWRSGSTFLGEAMQTHPGVYYHYEPLHYLRIRKARRGSLGNEAQEVLSSLLKCNYSATALKNYMKYDLQAHMTLGNNRRLVTYVEDQNLREDPNFLTQVCELFPIHLVKTVRVNLRITEALLHDRKIHPKIVFLVRDPRPLFLSRMEKGVRRWCTSSVDCGDPEVVCKDMVGDYIAMTYLQLKYPLSYMSVRFEDLSLHPDQTIQKILSFAGLEYTESIRNFIKTHTTETRGDVWSTFRNSQKKVFEWLDSDQLDWVEEIQQQCDLAMTLWGYKKFKPQQDNAESFFPLEYY